MIKVIHNLLYLNIINTELILFGDYMEESGRCWIDGSICCKSIKEYKSCEGCYRREEYRRKNPIVKKEK